MLLSGAVKSYEADKRIEGYSSQTLKVYKLQAKLLIKFFSNIPISEVSTYDLKQYLAESSKELKPSCLAHRIRFIKSLFHWSHEEGIIKNKPARKIKEPKVGKRIPKFLTEKEIEHLRDSCYLSMEKALFEFMFFNGLPYWGNCNSCS